MLRAVLSLAGIIVTVWLLITVFGITMPHVTSNMPALNRSVAHTVGLMQGNVTENGREPADDSTGPSAGQPGNSPAGQNAPSTASGNATYQIPGGPRVPTPATGRSDEPEIISPDTTAHLNPDHIHNIDQPGNAWIAPSGDASQTFNPNPAAFAPPNPLPAQPHWTWDVGNREFTNVVLTRVDADLVTIASDSGTAQIDISLLPGEMRRELHYDPVLAAEAAAARKNQAAAVTTSSP